MQRIIMKSKIHNAVITQAELNYEGSITIDSNLMEKANIIENERVQVVNLNNGARFETYVIEGGRNSGVICLNGPAARLGTVGDKIHIISYVILEEKELKEFKPAVILLKDKNQP